MLRIVMPFHVIAFPISNAFSAYQAHRFITKEVPMLPGSVKRSLSGIIKTTLFFDIRHSPDIHKFNVSFVENDLLLSDVSSGFLGIER